MSIILIILSWIKRNPQTALIIGLVIAGFFALRFYGNRQYYAGASDGRRSEAAEIEKAKSKEWADREAQIQKIKDDADKAVAQADIELQSVARARQQADLQFRSQFSAIDARAKEASSHVNEIEPSALPDAIRRQLASNRTAESTGQ